MYWLQHSFTLSVFVTLPVIVSLLSSTAKAAGGIVVLWNSSTIATATSIAFTRIAHPTQVNDLMIATISYRDGNVVVAAPTGWVLVTTERLGDFSGRVYLYFMTVFYKVLISNEPESYIFSFGTSSLPAVLGIVNFAGVDPKNPIDIAKGSFLGGPFYASANSLASTPSITTTVDNTMLVTSYGNLNADSWAAPSGMTEQLDMKNTFTFNMGVSLSIDTVLFPNNGNVGAKTATACCESPDSSVAHILALRPLMLTTINTNTTTATTSTTITTTTATTTETTTTKTTTTSITITTTTSSTTTLTITTTITTTAKTKTTSTTITTLTTTNTNPTTNSNINTNPFTSATTPPPTFITSTTNRRADSTANAGASSFSTKTASTADSFTTTTNGAYSSGAANILGTTSIRPSTIFFESTGSFATRATNNYDSTTIATKTAATAVTTKNTSNTYPTTNTSINTNAFTSTTAAPSTSTIIETNTSTRIDFTTSVDVSSFSTKTVSVTESFATFADTSSSDTDTILVITSIRFFTTVSETNGRFSKPITTDGAVTNSTSTTDAFITATSKPTTSSSITTRLPVSSVTFTTITIVLPTKETDDFSVSIIGIVLGPSFAVILLILIGIYVYKKKNTETTLLPLRGRVPALAHREEQVTEMILNPIHTHFTGDRFKSFLDEDSVDYDHSPSNINNHYSGNTLASNTEGFYSISDLDNCERSDGDYQMPNNFALTYSDYSIPDIHSNFNNINNLPPIQLATNFQAANSTNYTSIDGNNDFYSLNVDDTLVNSIISTVSGEEIAYKKFIDPSNKSAAKNNQAFSIADFSYQILSDHFTAGKSTEYSELQLIYSSATTSNTRAKDFLPAYPPVASMKALQRRYTDVAADPIYVVDGFNIPFEKVPLSPTNALTNSNVFLISETKI